MSNTVAYEDGISTVAHRAYRLQRQATASGRARTRARPAPCSATAASIRRSTTWRSGTPRCTTIACCAANRCDRPSRPRRRPTTRASKYGFGWRITGETLWHSGETVGFRNVIVRYPQRQLTVVVLTNRNEPEPYELAKKIAALAIRDCRRELPRLTGMHRGTSKTRGDGSGFSVKCHHSIG